VIAAPWSFAPAELPPALVSDEVRNANSTEARAGAAAREIAPRAATTAEQVGANPNLSEAGKRSEYTRLMIEPLKALHGARATLTTSEDVTQREAAALESNVTAPTLTEPQLARQLVVAQRFATLAPAEQTLWIAEAMNGTSPVKLAALVNEDPAITGLAPAQHARLQRIQREALIDRAAQARLTAKAELIAESRAAVEATIAAIERASDRTALKTAGLTTLRRGDMSDREKSAYISRNGLAAFQRLSA